MAFKCRDAALTQGEQCHFALRDALLEMGQPALAEHFRREQHPANCWALQLILEQTR
jgi:hypothetical protein